MEPLLNGSAVRTPCGVSWAAEKSQIKERLIVVRVLSERHTA